jgi:hypothetical protein
VCALERKNYCKQKSYKITKIEYRSRRGQKKNIRDLNLVVIKLMTIRVTKLPLKRELHKIKHNLLYKAWADKDLVYIVTCVTVNTDGVWIDNWGELNSYTFLTSSNYNRFTNSHTLQFSRAHIKPSLYFVSSQVLRQRLPTTDVPLRLGS